MRMWKEFKAFAIKGNFVDISIGLLIGAGITPVAASFIKDVVMPPIGIILGNVDFSNLFILLKEGHPVGPYATREAAAAAGAVTLNYGVFLNTLFTFFIVTWVAFLAVKAINVLREREKTDTAPTTRACPECLSMIPAAARRCAQCTAEVKPIA